MSVLMLARMNRRASPASGHGAPSKTLDDALFGVFRKQRIPKIIISELGIGRKGCAFLRMGEYDNLQEAEYYTGELRFMSSWAKSDFYLQVGLVVLFLFHMDGSRYMNISFDVL